MKTTRPQIKMTLVAQSKLGEVQIGDDLCTIAVRPANLRAREVLASSLISESGWAQPSPERPYFHATDDSPGTARNIVQSVLSISGGLKHDVQHSYTIAQSDSCLVIARALKARSRKPTAGLWVFDHHEVPYLIPADSEILPMMITMGGFFPDCRVYADYCDCGEIAQLEGWWEYRVHVTTRCLRFRNQALAAELSIPDLRLYDIVPGKRSAAKFGIIRRRDQPFSITCSQSVWDDHVLPGLVARLGRK
jgi:hypothetical protein